MPAIGIKKKKKGEETPAAGAPVVVEEEGAEAAAGGKKVKPEGGKSKLVTVILIIVLVASALFAGGVVTTKILLPAIMDDMMKNADNNTGGSAEDPLGDGEPVSELKIVGTGTLDEMTIQLAPNQEGVRSFLVMQMGVRFTDKKAHATFEEKKMEIQDIVLSTVMAKSRDELIGSENFESLKKVLASKIHKLFAADFKKNQVDVVISRYLIQP